MISKLVQLSLLLSAASIVSWAGTDDTAQQLLSIAAQQSDIFAKDARSFRLEADVRVQNQVPTEGHISVRWASKNRLWRRIDLGNLQQTDIQNGETTYLSRNAPFTPIRVRELIQLIAVLANRQNTNTNKGKNRIDQGVPATCFSVRFRERGEKPHEVCISSSSRDVLSDDWSALPDDHRRKEFTEYAEFDGRRYPRKMALFENGSKVVEVHVLHLEAEPFDESLLTPPSGAIVRRACDGIKHPIPLKIPDPLYPESSAQNRIMGDTTVAMTVLPDGSVDDIQLIGSGTQAMNAATLQTLKSWKFKPALCGSEPVAYDIEVVVSFRMR